MKFEIGKKANNIQIRLYNRKRKQTSSLFYLSALGDSEDEFGGIGSGLYYYDWV